MLRAAVQPCGRAAAAGLLRQALRAARGDDAGLVWLAVLGVIASVIGAFYYLRIVYFMYFGEETGTTGSTRTARCSGAFMALSAFIMVGGVINLFGIEGAASAAAASLVN